jgi:hypothetical protein
MNAKRNSAQLGVERLDERCMPSAVLGNVPAHVASAVSLHVATGAAAVAKPRILPIVLSIKISSEGSMPLKISGVGSGLGRFGGTGTLENVAYDPASNRVLGDGKATLVFKTGARLTLSFSVSASQTTHLGVSSIEFTGGTGRFVGATGGATMLCRSSGDPLTSHIFECNSKGSGILLLALR